MSSSAISSIASQAMNNVSNMTQTSNANDLTSLNSSEESSSNPVNSFSEVLNAAAHNAINTGKVAEHQTALALSGKGNMSDVVASVEEAKLTLQTTTALRDKFVSAYQEVMRMSI